MKKEVIWKVALVLAFTAGLLLGQAQPAPPAQAEPAEPQSPVAAQPQVKSQAEAQAITAMFQAPDPDARIKAAQDLIDKFADTEFKAIALFFMAISYQQKNDAENTVIFSERVLEVDPNHFQAMLTLASAVALRTREFDLDREEKLAKAEKYANQALEILKNAPRPNPNLTDEQWASAKKDFSAQAYESLALAALVRKDHNKAIGLFKKSLEIASTPDLTTSIRLGNAYTRAGKYDEAIATLDQVMADPNAEPQIKQFAQAEKARAAQAKSGSGPGTSPSPAQVEIKKAP